MTSQAQRPDLGWVDHFVGLVRAAAANNRTTPPLRVQMEYPGSNGMRVDVSLATDREDATLLVSFGVHMPLSATKGHYSSFLLYRAKPAASDPQEIKARIRAAFAGKVDPFATF